MKNPTLKDLQESVCDSSAFNGFSDYFKICKCFLDVLSNSNPTRIVSPSHQNYIFYQYDKVYGHKITRPLNSNLLIENPDRFKEDYEKFICFLGDLKKYKESINDKNEYRKFVESKLINRVIYTVQQSIGSIGDSFENPNQSRKRVGQLFEKMLKIIIQELGLECEPRTINIPIPGYKGYEMSYELDLVFSKNKAILTSETKYIHKDEIVGSVKTTSKDRIDKIFLDKYLLTKLLGRNVPVIAIFLHDVQRAKRGTSIFGINSTFKTNHFLGYTVALNRLDGVYYVDPRPEMTTNDKLREQVKDFQHFLLKDLWVLSGS